MTIDDRSESFVRELGEVLVGEVGGSMEVAIVDEPGDLSSLALASGPDRGWQVVTGSSDVHVRTVAHHAVGALAFRCRSTSGMVTVWL